MSRDAQLYVADVVAAGEAILRYIEGVSFEAFSANDEKRAAVERQLFVIGEAAARLPDEWKQRSQQLHSCSRWPTSWPAIGKSRKENTLPFTFR